MTSRSRAGVLDRIRLLSRHMSRREDEMFPYEDANPCDTCQRVTLERLTSGYTHRNFTGLVKSSSEGCKLCALLKHVCLRIQDSGCGLSNPSKIRDTENQLLQQIEEERHTDIPVQLRCRLSKYSDNYLSEVVQLNWRLTDGPGTLGLYKDSDTFFKPHLTGHRLSRRSDTAFNFLQIKNWLQESFGGDGKWEEAVTTLPKRVVDVLNLSDSSIVHLRDTRNLPQDHYLCLSHCWSESKPITTTTDSLAQRCHGIPLDDLSFTLRDTVLLARALGIRYVWIDSLCILQDSQDDWEVESSKMGGYYGSSLLTVIAGMKSSKGLFGERDPLPSPYCKLSLPAGQGCIYFSLYHHAPRRDFAEDCPKIYRRGWVLQEEILSPRVLSFEPTQTYFRTSLFERYESGPIVATFKSEILLRPGRWSNLVEQYCKMSLTKESDKLPALSGLAHEYQRRWNDQYLAGLWRNELWRQLQWYIVPDEGKPPRRPSKYRAPTWSWASVEGQKHIIFEWISSQRSSCIEILRASTVPTGHDPLGSVKSGILVARGSLLKGHRRSDEKADSTTPSSSSYAFYLIGGDDHEERLDSILGDIALDDLTSGEYEDVNLLFLTERFGLILRHVTGTVATYKRLGAINIFQRIGTKDIKEFIARLVPFMPLLLQLNDEK